MIWRSRPVAFLLSQLTGLQGSRANAARTSITPKSATRLRHIIRPFTRQGAWVGSKVEPDRQTTVRRVGGVDALRVTADQFGQHRRVVVGSGRWQLQVFGGAVRAERQRVDGHGVGSTSHMNASTWLRRLPPPRYRPGHVGSAITPSKTRVVRYTPGTAATAASSASRPTVAAA